MPQTTIVIMVDGLDPEYLETCSMPILRQLAADGFMVEGKAMVPTVTNVNKRIPDYRQLPSGPRHYYQLLVQPADRLGTLYGIRGIH